MKIARGLNSNSHGVFVMQKFCVLVSFLLFCAFLFSAQLGPPLYTILSPSGGDDTAQIQAALNAAGAGKPPVMLSAGTYTLCSQLSIITHAGTVLMGPAQTNIDNGSVGGPGTPNSVARLSLANCGSPTFTNGQAAILVNQQFVTIQDFDIVGLSGGTQVDCIHTVTGGNIIKGMGLEGCYNGINIDATNTNCCSTYNQDTHVDNNVIIYAYNYGIVCQATTGSGCTDNFFTNNHLDVMANNNSFACLTGCGNSLITGNRMEDGAEGLAVYYSTGAAGYITANGNYFQQITPVQLENVYNSIFNNNQYNCNFATPAVEFEGTGGNGAITSIGNETAGCSAMYKVDSGSGVGGSSIFMDLATNEGANPAYTDTTTAGQIERQVAVALNGGGGYLSITPSGTTFTPVLDNNRRAFEFDFVANSTIADFAYHVSGVSGVFRIKQDATGGRTTTWNAAYLNQPTLTGLTLSTCTYVPWTMTASSIVLQTPIQNVSCT